MEDTTGFLYVAEYAPGGIRKHDEWAADENSLYFIAIKWKEVLLEAESGTGR